MYSFNSMLQGENMLLAFIICIRNTFLSKPHLRLLSAIQIESFDTTPLPVLDENHFHLPHRSSSVAAGRM